MILDSKTQLAKLLATEDITVLHSNKAKTASFDVKNRVLTLPNWVVSGDLNEDVIDVFTGHEVGHALWTLMVDWEKAILTDKLHKGITNVVEDARIEKRIKGKYPGFVKSFVGGYKQLAKRNFFYEDFRDIPKMNMVDRINLHCKMGSLSGIPFTEEEQYFVNLVENVWNWKDVVVVVKEIMAYMQDLQDEEAEEQQALSMEDSDDSGPGGEDMEGEWEDEDLRVGDELTEDLVKTQERFNDAVEDHMTSRSDRDYREVIYWSIPEANMSEILVPYKEVNEQMSNQIAKLDSVHRGDMQMVQLNPNGVQRYYDRAEDPAKVASEFMKFKRNSQKIVGYMAKEFERKKSANEYRKETIAKTGILDMNKIHQYKFNEDLFLRNTLRPDGKNHGMVMLLDWSASMTYHLFDTIKQLMSLVWFCNKVNIPFEVYAFTNAYHDFDIQGFEERQQQSNDKIRKGITTWNLKPGDAHFGLMGVDNFKMLNLFSSRMNAKQLNQMMKNIFRRGIAAFSRSEHWGRFSLSSTPLLPAYCALDKIIPAFQEYNNLDITSLLVLTDGAGNVEFHGIQPHEEGGNRNFKGTDTRLLDRKSKREYKFKDYSPSMAYYRSAEVAEKQIIGMLKDRYGFRTIGLFLDGESNGRTLRQKTLEQYLGWKYHNQKEFVRVRAEIKKSGVGTVPVPSFDEYYLVPVGKIRDTSDDLVIEGDWTAGKMKNAFSKHQTQRFGNKVLVNRMMDIIA